VLDEPFLPLLPKRRRRPFRVIIRQPKISSCCRDIRTTNEFRNTDREPSESIVIILYLRHSAYVNRSPRKSSGPALGLFILTKQPTTDHDDDDDEVPPLAFAGDGSERQDHGTYRSVFWVKVKVRSRIKYCRIRRRCLAARLTQYLFVRSVCFSFAGASPAYGAF